MTLKKLSLLLAVPLLGLTFAACSQESADTSAASDTAVHTPKLLSHQSVS